MIVNLIKTLILLYPSIPYVHIGFGDNIPFFILSVVYLVLLKEVKIDNALIYIIFSFFITLLSYNVHKSLNHQVELKYTLLGLRHLVTNFVILLAIYNISLNETRSFFIRGLMIGVVFSFSFGILELFFPSIMVKDFIFHFPRSMHELGWLLGENSRIRLLWPEPSYAGGWLVIFAFPILLMIREQNKLIGNLILILLFILFIVMNPKSSMLIILVSAIIVFVFRVNIFQGISNTIKIILILFIPTILIYSLYRERADYILSIISFGFDIIRDRGFSIEYIMLQEKVSTSQTIRPIKIITYLQLMWQEKYTFFLGLTPYGLDELVVRNISMISDAILGLGNFSISEKISFQSTLFESVAWYSIVYLGYVVTIIVNYYKSLRNSSVGETLSKFMVLFTAIYLTIIINPHIMTGIYAISCIKLCQNLRCKD